MLSPRSTICIAPRISTKRYTFLLYCNPANIAYLARAEWACEKEVYGAFIGVMKQAGGFVATDWLQPVHAVSRPSVDSGQWRVQDGPYA